MNIRDLKRAVGEANVWMKKAGKWAAAATEGARADQLKPSRRQPGQPAQQPRQNFQRAIELKGRRVMATEAHARLDRTRERRNILEKMLQDGASAYGEEGREVVESTHSDIAARVCDA